MKAIKCYSGKQEYEYCYILLQYQRIYFMFYYLYMQDPSKLDEEIPIFMNDDAEYTFLKYHKIEGQEVIPTAFLMVRS